MNKKIILEEKTIKEVRYQLRRVANKFAIVKLNPELSEADFIDTLKEFNNEAKAREIFAKL